MAPQHLLLQGAFLLPFLVSSISAFPSFPYNTDSNANSKAIDTELNHLQPHSHFPTLLTKRQQQNRTLDNPSIAGALPSNPGTRLGCYADDAATYRLLPTLFAASDTLTLEACAFFCGPSSPYSGVEFGRECWCASAQSGFSPTSPSTIAAKVGDEQCSLPCAGNSAQKCGASQRIEVYSNALYRPPTIANITGYEPLGCYRESSPRLLPYAPLGDDALTALKCQQHCASQPEAFPYFGLEFGRECWCGVSPPSFAQRVPDAECSMPCAGRPDRELCGAQDRVTAYGRAFEMPPDVGEYRYQGCFTDSPVVGQRSLTGKVVVSNAADGGMTLQKCQTACEADGYPYFGTEYGSQCFCGTSLYDEVDEGDVSDDEDDIPARAVVVDDRECSMRCVGDKTNKTTCGDANRLSVYRNGDVSDAHILPRAEIHDQNPALTRWDYRGCYRDDTAQRTLTGTSWRNDGMTVVMCITYCSTRNFPIAGLEFQNECYCGISGNLDLGRGDLVDDSQCEELCSGSPDEFCGAPRRLSVYQLTSV